MSTSYWTVWLRAKESVLAYGEDDWNTDKGGEYVWSGMDIEKG